MDRIAVERITNKLKAQREELVRLSEEYKYLRKTHKDLFNDVENVIDKVDSFYEENNILVRTFVTGTKEIRESYRELNELMTQQEMKIHEIDESFSRLSEHYSAPKEAIAETMAKLQKYVKLKEELDNTDSSSPYFKDVAKQLERAEKALTKTNLDTQMWYDYLNDANDLTKEHIELENELKEKVEDVAQAQGKLNKALKDGEQTLKNFKKNGWSDLLGGLFNALKNLATAAWDKMYEVDQAGRDFGRHMGMSTQELERHTDSLYNNYSNLAGKLGMEFKDMYKFQVQYAEVTEKATMLSMDQVGAMASVTRNVGEEAVGVASKNLDIFATSADATIEYLAKGTSRAALEGLNVKKYSEAFANNIKMASKYTFKEGIDGIQKMTLLSQRLKFDMQSIGAAMDKFSTIEGAIEASAKIQVLGGVFAQNFGNPLQAMSEALLDAEGFTERIINSVSTQARFDAKTGEIDLAPIDKQRLKAYAEALGISYDEIHNMATQTRKAKEIERVVDKDTFTKEEIAYLSNKAQYDKETGKWKIVGVDGEDVVKDISQLDSETLDKIRKVDSHEKMLNANVTEIKDTLIAQANLQKSYQEHETGDKEKALLYAAGKLNNLPEDMKDIIIKMRWIIGLLGASSVMQMAGGGLKAVRSMFTRSTTSTGAANGAVRGVANGPVRGAANGPVRGAANGPVRGAANAAKGAGRGLSKTLGVLGAAYTVYEVGSSISNYNDVKSEIMASTDMGEYEKAKAINDAKKERNRNIGGAIGGFGLASLVGMGLMSTGVGFLPGLLITGVAGYLGSKGGEMIGEAVTEDVNETLKEVQGENGDIQDTEGDSNSTMMEKIEAIRVSTVAIQSNTSTFGGGRNYYHVVHSDSSSQSQSSEIKLSDLKINVNGEIKLNGGNGSSSGQLDVSELLNNNEFIMGISRIIKEQINKEVGGRIPQNTPS